MLISMLILIATMSVSVAVVCKMKKDRRLLKETPLDAQAGSELEQNKATTFSEAPCPLFSLGQRILDNSPFSDTSFRPRSSSASSSASSPPPQSSPTANTTPALVPEPRRVQFTPLVPQRTSVHHVNMLNLGLGEDFVAADADEVPSLHQTPGIQQDKEAYVGCTPLSPLSPPPWSPQPPKFSSVQTPKSSVSPQPKNETATTTVRDNRNSSPTLSEEERTRRDSKLASLVKHSKVARLLFKLKPTKSLHKHKGRSPSRHAVRSH